VTLDDEGEMTSLLEARNGRWFVVRTRYAEQQPENLTAVEDRSTVSVAEELIRDLERDPDGWSRHWFFGGWLAQAEIAALRAAIHAAQEREADFNRRMELAQRPWADEEIARRDKLCSRRAKDEETCGLSPGGRRARHRSEVMEGLIGRLRKAIRKRWPRHTVARRDADWDWF